MSCLDRIVTIVLIAACANPHSLASSEPVLDDSNAGRGTLGMLIITREGMVLAADSRTTYSNRRHDDRAVKVFKMGEHSGCMIAGFVLKPPAAGIRGFNLPQEIKNISSTPGIMDDPSVFEGLLENRLKNAVRDGLVEIPTE